MSADTRSLDDAVYLKFKEMMKHRSRTSQKGSIVSKKVHKVEVMRHEGPIMLPEQMSTQQAIDTLTQKLQYDSQPVLVREMIPVFAWDGALALAKAIEEQFGLVLQTNTPGFWTDHPPQQIAINTGPDTTALVPWGRFKLPGVPGWVSTGVTGYEGRTVFEVVSETTHGAERLVRKLISRTREVALAGSIYRGKAIEIKFTDGDGDAMQFPEISFVRITNQPVIFNRELERAIEANIMTPIRYAAQARACGAPLKRGALLAGPYGTGKTLTAGWVARTATENGWTFIYIPKVEELSTALRFAQGFQPAVVFAEDVERLVGEKRDDRVNQLLNTLDGIGAKTAEIMVILTSNFAEVINEAMRRPGRIDLVLSVDPPDAEAAQRLVKHYGEGQIAADEDLVEVGVILAGQKPAVIREVVERSKFEALRRTEGKSAELTADDLVATARVLKSEQELFRKRPAEASTAEHITRWFDERITHGVHRHVPTIVRRALDGVPTEAPF